MQGKSVKGKGLVIVHTGDGKGKTTAALGMALRAVGHGQNVVMIQFIKGQWTSGEVNAIAKLAPYLEIIPMGRGFMWTEEEKQSEENLRLVRDAWDLCRSKMMSREYKMVIFDEINNVISYGMLPVEEVIEALATKPSDVHVVLTGRGAHPALIERADLVTEMCDIKHPFRQGIAAQKGVDF
jgi:cob(I)alamin adenosyltransferase